ncbi:hypothetical protein CAI21_07030 [Alkalilimnicola ehrlichii]|uniref:Pilus assembly protein PilW n=1 Tax=Alkalilimnicola ehrlichii TaxID=351052 RepID=A0A3E0WY70_9GAMM|nr:PilW family protein [Alkalilimnicola ehrlichii]RFA30391.1 hypothetical protein CAI21_07030 [Alkalilimnicola ehrlichii]RFA37960.1 hypothetical protein CAL65_08375 [Alkalilimnicola ehrlichii]
MPLESSKGASKGFSLVELMVALVIGLILTAGIINLFLGSHRSYQMNEDMSRVQENMRFALGRLQADLRMTAFSGGIPFSVISHLNPAGSEGISPHAAGGPAILGWEARGTGVGDEYALRASAIGNAGDWNNGTGEGFPTALVGAAVRGSDVLLSSGLRRLPVTLPNNATNGESIRTVGSSGIEQGRIVLIMRDDLTGGDLFQKTNSADETDITRGEGGTPGNATTTALLNHDASSVVYEAGTFAYYIGIGAGGEPGLFRRDLAALTPAQELISGVQSMQVLYGINADGNVGASTYVTAEDVTNWENVYSVRVSLLLTSDRQVQDIPSTGIYNLLGTRLQVPAGEEDARLRKVATTTVAIRNRLD